ncbi:MAG: cytochrome c maturation protein CcmE [Alphaproteobacteria bacterium]|nr:cytochrome c maturation protein CcmE [Alphaproteobacteria bacterium]
MKPKHRRLIWIVSGLICLVTAVFLMMVGLRDSLVFFFSPTELAHKNLSSSEVIRLGGLVKPGSLTRTSPTSVRFTVTDFQTELDVNYTGQLPDLFREGQGVVATGKLTDKAHFVASQLLAKHDEKYVPKEVTRALKQPRGPQP